MTAYIRGIIIQLHVVFEMKNLGSLHHFLGIEVKHTKAGFVTS